MSKKVLMKMLRNYNLRSLTGHTVTFEKNKPTPVPKEVVQEALALGAGMCDEDELPDEDEVTNAVPTEPGGEERKELIVAAMENMVIENVRGDFDAGGAPQLKKLSARLGFNVIKQERDSLWEEIQASKGD